MRIDLPMSGAWNALCEQYRANLPFPDPALQVQIYQGYQHALLEVTQGLAQLFSHKKTVAFTSFSEPAFESLAIGFSQQGYNVIALEQSQLENPADWLEKVQNDLLFVVFGVDDPVTGRIYEAQKLNEALKDKRVFRISIEHAAFRFRELLRPAPFEVKVLSLRPERALVLAGERCRVTPTLAPRLAWRTESQDAIRNDLKQVEKSKIEELSARVEAFENGLPAGFLRYLDARTPRVFDRAVFYHPELDGSAVVDRLVDSSEAIATTPGEESSAETTSPCRWNSPRLAEWFQTQGLSEAHVRGTLIVSSDLIKNDLSERLARIASDILKIQKGE